MMKLYSNNVRLAKKIALGTLLSGIIFLLGFYFSYDFSLAIGGIFLGLGVFLIVVTLLISDLIAAKRQHFNAKETTTTILWNSASLVILIIFTIIGLGLANSSKIIIKNNSKEPIKNILISGCQTVEVNEIAANSSETIHLFYCQNFQPECQVNINYTTQNSIENDILLIETTPFSAEKIIYEIN